VYEADAQGSCLDLLVMIALYLNKQSRKNKA
jgi:hypothetical protein